MNNIYIMKLLFLLIIVIIIYIFFILQFEPFAPRYEPQQQADEDETVMQKAYRAYVLEGEESNQAAKDESNEIYNINTIPNRNYRGERGYNMIPSNLLRQAMGISDTYK